MGILVKKEPADYTTPVVSLAMAKANANIYYTDQDDLLEIFLQASIQDAEEYTGIIIQERSVTISLSGFGQFVDLEGATPLTTVTAVSYVDVDGNKQTLTVDEDFEVIKDGYSLYFKMAEFPEVQKDTDYPIIVTGKMGYTDASVPKAIQSAILLQFSYKEEYRGDAPKTGVDRSFKSALRPFKYR